MANDNPTTADEYVADSKRRQKACKEFEAELGPRPEIPAFDTAAGARVAHVKYETGSLFTGYGVCLPRAELSAYFAWQAATYPVEFAAFEKERNPS